LRNLQYGIDAQRCGFRSAGGAQALATIATVLQIAPKQGRDILPTLTSTLAPSPKLSPRTLTETT